MPPEQRDRSGPGEQQLRLHPADRPDARILVADPAAVALCQAGGRAGRDRRDRAGCRSGSATGRGGRAMSPVIDTGQTSWQNKHETYVQSLRRVLQTVNDPPQTGDPLQRYNRMTGTLQTLIGRALQEDVRLRAFGGGWSFSGAPATDGYLLDTSPLNLWFRVRDRSIHPDFQGPRDGLYFLQCGNSIAGL